MYFKYAYLFFTILLSLAAHTSSAQISLMPLDYNHAISSAQEERVERRQAARIETLPFVDDFATGGPFPNTDLWLDDHVFVNGTMAINPPSLGVATFDGIDNTGTPYGINGAGDTLTSVGIDLENANTDNLFLSYFVQPKGFGEGPEANDSLILEFKSSDGQWLEQRAYTGVDGSFPSSDVVFSFDAVEIAAAGFLFDDFQFRFRNTTSGSGAVDLWHLDVVRLTDNQIPSATYIDVAFQFPTQGILNRYSAMPTKHFKNNTASHLRDNFTFGIFNHDSAPRPIAGENSEMSITELSTGQEVLSPEQYLTNVSLLNIGADTSISIEVTNGFSISTGSFGDQDDLIFETLFSLDPDPSNNDDGLLDNNFLRQQTIISDYFAYDDGTAEVGIQARGENTQIAVAFQTSVADTLSAIQIMFPHVRGDVTNQNFNLQVWKGSLDSEPLAFNGILLNPIFADEFLDTLQGFTTFRLEDTFSGELQPVALEANTTFYIGWQQVDNETIDAIPVGFDLTNNDASQYQFFRTTQEDEWMSFDSVGISGAVMIRPIMGVDNAFSTSVDVVENQNYTLSPNPSRGIINIESRSALNISTYLNVFDINGRLVYNEPFDNNTIDLEYLPSGMYIANLTDQHRNLLFTEKIIIQAK